MVNAKILVFLIAFILAMNVSHSFQTNSSNYRNFPLVVSSGGDIANSSSYKTYTATGIIAGIINSSNYKNLLGFFYTRVLANRQSWKSSKQMRRWILLQQCVQKQHMSCRRRSSWREW